MNFKENDLQFAALRGVTHLQLQEQIATFREGTRYANLCAPAIIGNGIHRLSDKEERDLITIFHSKKRYLDLLKFTPASGAATRMFKFLFQYLEENNTTNNTNASLFLENVEKFPFYKEVKKKNEGKLPNGDHCPFTKTMLDKDLLNYGSIPKGLFPFHKYSSHNATAFEEHLFEAALYASVNNRAKLHFTISETHLQKFTTTFKNEQKRIEDKTGVSFDINYSYQKSSTDTIAVDLENNPIRTQEGDLYFRPGGHGALIENLNEQVADIIFIKNIDNVVVSEYAEEVAQHKIILAGKLISLQEKAFNYLHLIDKKEVSTDLILEITEFLQNEFGLKLTPNLETLSLNQKIQYVKEMLDRPIRVCGMVPNKGEPGGGPFWVKEENGNESLQIIEGVQIDPNNKQQQEIKNASTHFNPVDIVCGVKNYKGEKYDLIKYMDKKASFIAQKTIAGEPIKALEHPGLWNGAMAYWSSIFIEVPLITFNPVKTVNDLLKPAHQVTS